MHESSTGSKIPICFCVYFRLGKVPCFTNNATPVRHWKHLIWHSMTTALSVSSSSCVYGGGGLQSFCVYVCVCMFVQAFVCVCVCKITVAKWPITIQDFPVSSSPSVLLMRCLDVWIQILLNNLWSSALHGMVLVRTSVCFLLRSSLCR